jgi:hypothetical protein
VEPHRRQSESPLHGGHDDLELTVGEPTIEVSSFDRSSKWSNSSAAGPAVAGETFMHGLGGDQSAGERVVERCADTTSVDGAEVEQHAERRDHTKWTAPHRSEIDVVGCSMDDDAGHSWATFASDDHIDRVVVAAAHTPDVCSGAMRRDRVGSECE